MPFLDELKQFLTQRVAPAVASIGQQLGAYSLGGQQGVQNLAENQRLQQQQNFDLLQRNTLTAYQQAALKQQQDQADAAAGQQHFENLFKMAHGKATGELIDAKPGDPGAFTESGMFEGEPDVTMAPANVSKPKPFTYKPTDEDIQAHPWLAQYKDNGIDMPAASFPTFMKDMGLGGKTQADQDFTDELQLRGKNLGDDIDSLFDPNRIKGLYGNQYVTPEMLSDLAIQKKKFHDDLATALTIDAHKKNTAAINSFESRLRQPLDWEKQIQKQQDQKFQEHLATLTHATNYDYDHPDPTPEDIKQGLEAYKANGVKALTALHTLNPKLERAVMSEGSKIGLNPITLTNEELNNRGLSQVALNRIHEAQNILTQPGIDNAIGPLKSRAKAFMAGTLGSGIDPRVQTLSNKVSQALAQVGRIHYTARGSANQNIQEKLNAFANAKIMDGPTLRTGLSDLETLMNDYAHEGDTNSVAGALGLNSQGTNLGFGGKK